MPTVACPTLRHCLKENDCLENLAGLGNVAYAFVKSDLAAPLTRSGVKYSTPTFKSGKGLYKFELQDQMQSIVGESLKKRQGFKQTFEFAFEAVNEIISKTARALNNLDVCFIVPDNDGFQIMYDPYHDVKFDDGGISTNTGKASNDDRQTTCTATLEPVMHPNFWVDPPTNGGWESLLADESSSD